MKHGSPTRADAGLRNRTSSTKAASRCRPAPWASIAVKLPLPPSCLPTLWNATIASATVTSPLPGLLRDRRRRFHRRGRLRLRHGPHRRHHQRRRAPPVDRRHGGSSGLASGGRGMRRDRHQGRPQGRGAVRLRRSEIGRHALARRDRAGAGRVWSATGSVRSHRSSSPSRSAGCRRRAQGRSCAAP